MTVLAGWSALLSRLWRVEGLIGFFVNTLARGATVSELLGRVKAKVLEGPAWSESGQCAACRTARCSRPHCRG